MAEYKTGQKIWVVKNALTKGIRCAKIHEVETYTVKDRCLQTGWAWVESGKILLSTNTQIKSYLKADRDFFATKEAAIERANALRSKQIAALERRIKKLKELEF
jgi:hypothetical protein